MGRRQFFSLLFLIVVALILIPHGGFVAGKKRKKSAKRTSSTKTYSSDHTVNGGGIKRNGPPPPPPPPPSEAPPSRSQRKGSSNNMMANDSGNNINNNNNLNNNMNKNMNSNNDRPLSITPNFIHFEESPACIPVVQTVSLEHQLTYALGTDLKLYTITSDNAHFHPAMFKQQSLSPGKATTFQVIFLPRSTGETEATLTLKTSDGTYRLNVRGVGKPNPYGL